MATLGGGTLAAGGGGVALGSAILSGATLGVGLLIGGLIFNAKANSFLEEADEAWDQMLKNEKAINKIISPMYQEKIALLENQIAEKDKHIATLHELMDSLKRENAMLREQLSKYQADEVIGRHPFPLGSAEPESKELSHL